jgi:DNA-binding NtrC family response regulator
MDEVLIIDDDQKNIFALAATLRAKGWKVRSAGSAEEGMKMLSSNAATYRSFLSQPRQ